MKFGCRVIEAPFTFASPRDIQWPMRWWSPSTGGKICDQRFVKECHLFGCRRLEHFEPSGHCISFYGGILHAPTLKSVEENIRRRRKIMQFNGSAKGSGLEPQGIPLGPPPSARFDDYGETERKKFLAEFPLQRLDLSAPFFIAEA